MLANQLTEAVFDLSMAWDGSRLAELRIGPDVMFPAVSLQVATSGGQLSDEGLPVQTAISISFVFASGRVVSA